MTPIIEIQNLCIDYALASGTLRAVDNVSLSIAEGEVLGIAGESGSGKSSLATALLGLLDTGNARTTGELRFEGRDMAKLDPAGWRSIRGRKLGAVFQSPQDSFNPTMTIGQQIEEAVRTHFRPSKDEARKRALEALDKVRMPRSKEVLDNYAFELSGGMCQRAALAMALALEPSLLIADEPTSSLDLLAQVEITKLLDQLHTDLGLSMLIISHDLGLIGRLASRVVVMRRGRVVEAGATQQVFGAPADAYTRKLVGSIARLDSEAASSHLTETVA